MGSQVAEGYAENLHFHYTPLYYFDKFTISSPESDVTGHRKIRK